MATFGPGHPHCHQHEFSHFLPLKGYTLAQDWCQYYCPQPAVTATCTVGKAHPTPTTIQPKQAHKPSTSCPRGNLQCQLYRELMEDSKQDACNACLCLESQPTVTVIVAPTSTKHQSSKTSSQHSSTHSSPPSHTSTHSTSAHTSASHQASTHPSSKPSHSSSAAKSSSNPHSTPSSHLSSQTSSHTSPKASSMSPSHAASSSTSKSSSTSSLLFKTSITENPTISSSVCTPTTTITTTTTTFTIITKRALVTQHEAVAVAMVIGCPTPSVSLSDSLSVTLSKSLSSSIASSSSFTSSSASSVVPSISSSASASLSISLSVSASASISISLPVFVPPVTTTPSSSSSILPPESTCTTPSEFILQVAPGSPLAGNYIQVTPDDTTEDEDPGTFTESIIDAATFSIGSNRRLMTTSYFIDGGEPERDTLIANLQGLTSPTVEFSTLVSLDVTGFVEFDLSCEFVAVGAQGTLSCFARGDETSFGSCGTLILGPPTDGCTPVTLDVLNTDGSSVCNNINGGFLSRDSRV